MAVNVYHTSVIPSGPDEDYQIPTFAEDWEITPTIAYNDGIKSHDHMYCPAHKEWCKNRWTFYFPFDLHFRCSNEHRMIGSDTHGDKLQDLFMISPNWWNDELPEIQIRYNTLFWTDAKNVWVEYTGHPTVAQHGFSVVPGTFPVSSWMRSLPIGIVPHRIDDDIVIKRGTPIFHAKFVRGKDTFKLSRKTPSPDKLERIKQDQQLKHWAPYKSWDLIMKRESKCPFRIHF